MNILAILVLYHDCISGALISNRLKKSPVEQQAYSNKKNNVIIDIFSSLIINGNHRIKYFEAGLLAKPVGSYATLHPGPT